MPRKPKEVLPGRNRFSFLAPIKGKTAKTYTFATSQAQRRPLFTFLVLLVLLFALIAIAKFLTSPKIAQKANEQVTKEVSTFSIGKAPTITLHAQVEKSQVIQIVAQSSGIVNKINVVDGKSVNRGTTLISLATNYQGGNAPSAQRQLAQSQYNTATTTQQLEKDIIAKQRDIANKTDENADQLRDITNQSLDETRSLVSLNESILSQIDTNLNTLENNNVGGANDATILQTKQLKAQLLSATNQARASLRQAEFTQDPNKPPAQLSDLQKDLAQKQLDLQEKTLALNVETARLQVALAQINEAIMFPAAPFAGSVERVHVKVGQNVTPGTILVTFSGNNNSLTAIALVPRNIAVNISQLQSSYLIINNQKVEELDPYVSKEATNGQLYSVIFGIPNQYAQTLTDQGFIDVEVPFGTNYTSASAPFIPLDAVHQTQDQAEVFTIDGDSAKGKKVTLGEVQGNFVQITSGLSAADIIIVNRNIVSGDKIKAN